MNITENVRDTHRNGMSYPMQLVEHHQGLLCAEICTLLRLKNNRQLFDVG